jgi:hypothetical protein
VASQYQFAPIFLIRMAGVPFDALEKLATVGTSAAARELLVRRERFVKAKAEVRIRLRSERESFSEEEYRLWDKAIRHDIAPATIVPHSDPFVLYAEAITELSGAQSKLDETLKSELERARSALIGSVQSLLLPYLIFAGDEVARRLGQQFPISATLPPRNKEARAHERTAVLYLQRICAKNDSLSAFGPSGWGSVKAVGSGLTLSPEEGVTLREAFLERWTAHGLAAAINSDAEARLELSPRVHPNGRIENDRFIFAENEKAVALDPETTELIHRCDGQTPAHSLGAEVKLLQDLAHQQILRWEMEVPALDPYAFETLIRDVSQWRKTDVRERWLRLVEAIAALPKRFIETSDTAERMRIMDRAGQMLDKLGAHHAASGRFLYAATNPIGEECLRECNFSISENLIDEVATEAVPWIDLWRDCYAFVATRVAEGLRTIFESAKRDAIPLPGFLRLCENAKLSLTGPGLVGLAHIAFQEIKAAFRELMGPHANQAEYNLTADDCHFVRRNFRYEKFDEFTYPSADLQLAAKSIQAVARGDYQWILAEFHPPVALLHHGFYWSCPDKPALSEALSATVSEKPSFYFGFSAADFTATTTVRLFDALPDLNYFVAPQRANPNWRAISPAETEVFVDKMSGDVCLRKIENHHYLGSFARGWLIPLGFHPFQFGMVPHMPRLRCGRIIVQRRSWVIALAELGKGDFTGVSSDLVLAVERLRAARDLPRYVYIRPTEQALRRSGAEGRDKDTKPVFVDLESYLFLEIFLRWLTKAGELEVTEMLPAPDELLWQEPDSENFREHGGHRTFELRTLVIPRK